MLLVGGESVKANCRHCHHYARHVKTKVKCYRCRESTWSCDGCLPGGSAPYCCWNCFPEPRNTTLDGASVEADINSLCIDTIPSKAVNLNNPDALIAPLVGFTRTLVNQTPGKSFTVHYYTYYRREGSAAPIPDLVLSRGELVVTVPGSRGAARLEGGQFWPLPGCSDVTSILKEGSSVKVSHLLRQRMKKAQESDILDDGMLEYVTKLRLMVGEGDNHVLFLSRLYALLHSAAVVEAVGGYWVGVDDPETIRPYAHKEHWCEVIANCKHPLIIPPGYTDNMRNVLITAAQSRWPTKAILPQTDGCPMCMGWDLPEDFYFTVFSHTDCETPTTAKLAKALSVHTVLAAVDAYVSYYRLQSQWTYVVNRGLAGVMLLAGQTPDYPHPRHLAEILCLLWDSGSTDIGESVVIPLCAKGTPAQGVLMQGLISRAILHHVPWQLQDMAVFGKIVEEHLADVVDIDSGSLTLGSLRSSVVHVMAGLLRKGGMQASRMFLDAAPAALKPFYQSLGHVTLQKYIHLCTFMGALQTPLPMAPWEWFILGMPESEDIGRCVLEENSFNGVVTQTPPQLVTAIDVGKMALFGLIDENGYIPETGPEFPVDGDHLFALPERVCSSRVGKAYLQGKTLKICPQKIVGVDKAWKLPEDLRAGDDLEHSLDVTAPKNVDAVVREAKGELGELARPEDSDDGSSAIAVLERKPFLTQTSGKSDNEWNSDLGCKIDPATSSTGTGHGACCAMTAMEVDAYGKEVSREGRQPVVLPDQNVRERFGNISEIIAELPERKVRAPTMVVSFDVSGGSHCGPNALAKSAKMQCLGSPYDSAEFWKQRAEANGMVQTAQKGWWDDRVMTAVSSDDVSVAWYDTTSGSIHHHGLGKRFVYYVHQDQHFSAAAPAEEDNCTKLEHCETAPQNT